ncbi:hypothetical protein GCM10010420_45860 [Streptomyces glaucosporus]|uniref:Uncharacterized protein n=1 Tax=Streptomyces glaucosporus TaxID=284044 RepID=A0ABN3IRA2_9ACTN
MEIRTARVIGQVTTLIDWVHKVKMRAYVRKRGRRGNKGVGSGLARGVSGPGGGPGGGRPWRRAPGESRAGRRSGLLAVPASPSSRGIRRGRARFSAGRGGGPRPGRALAGGPGRGPLRRGGFRRAAVAAGTAWAPGRGMRKGPSVRTARFVCEGWPHPRGASPARTRRKAWWRTRGRVVAPAAAGRAGSGGAGIAVRPRRAGGQAGVRHSEA